MLATVYQVESDLVVQIIPLCFLALAMAQMPFIPDIPIDSASTHSRASIGPVMCLSNAVRLTKCWPHSRQWYVHLAAI